jgi:hypothetical protein
MDDEQKSRCAEVILECGGQLLDLPIAAWGRDWIGEQTLMSKLNNAQEIVVSFEGEFRYDEDEDDVHPREFRNEFKIDPDVLTVVKHDGSILKVGRQSWPNSIAGVEPIMDTNLADTVMRILTECWGGNVQEHDEKREVGSVGSARISRNMTVFTRAKSNSTGSSPDDSMPF